MGLLFLRGCCVTISTLAFLLLAGIDEHQWGLGLSWTFGWALRATDGGHPSDDFMPGYYRVIGSAPVVFGKVNVGVTDTAVINGNGDIIRPWLTPLKTERRQGRLSGLGRKPFYF
jgi:hypothetical protein